MAAPDSEHAPELNVTRARQGRRGVHIFWVLTISLLLTVLAFAVIWAVNSGQLARVNGQARTDQPSARQFDTPVTPALPQGGEPAGDAVPAQQAQ